MAIKLVSVKITFILPLELARRWC